MGHEHIERRRAFRVRAPGGIASLSFGPETHNLNVRNLSVGGALLSGGWGSKDLNVSDPVRLRICWPRMGPTEVLATVVRIDKDRGELAVQFSKSDERIAVVRSFVLQHQQIERPSAVVYCQTESEAMEEAAESLRDILDALGLEASLVTSSADVLVAIRRSASLSAVFLTPGEQGRKLSAFLASSYPHVTRIVIGSPTPEWDELAHRYISLPLNRAQIERTVQEDVPRPESDLPVG